MIFASIRHNLASLLRFSGRDPRALFWPYAILIVLLDYIAMAALIVPEIFGSIARMQKFAAQHPELTTVDSGPDHVSISIQGYHPELMPDMAGLFAGFGLAGLLTILLLAAAVARRLRDRGKPAWHGLIPLPFLAVGLGIMPLLFHSITAQEPDVHAFLQLFPLLFINNAIYLASLLYLIVQLANPRPTTPASAR